jgi:hypothetical protein
MRPGDDEASVTRGSVFCAAADSRAGQQDITSSADPMPPRRRASELRVQSTLRAGNRAALVSDDARDEIGS